MRSRGPGGDVEEEPLARLLRAVLPLVALAGLAAVAFVFLVGLDPGPQRAVVGAEATVRAAVSSRPRRVCFHDNNPCAWLTVVEGDLVAFNTSGPLPEEFGRAGVGWCPTSGWFGANATGSRFDQQGRLVRGPAPRGLDRFGVSVDRQGRVVIDFRSLTVGLREFDVVETTPAAGPDCETIPFDRSADLRLAG